MALTTVRKFDSTYRDPETGWYYAGGVGPSNPNATGQVATQQVTQPSVQPVTQPTATTSTTTTKTQSYTPSKAYTPTSTYQAPATYERSKFRTSSDTNRYNDLVKQTEANRPEAYTSAYESNIQSILDTINNKPKFDINTDANFDMLYNNYKESYQANADRAMRDTMANANAASGGYGSSYAQAVGQQAYDQTMQGLNDRNLQLAQLAYQMYGDDVANDYRKLNAYQGQDQIEYGRHRDDVNDWQTDRNYYANRYDTSYGRDYQKYSDDENARYGQYVDDRNFGYQQYVNDRDFDYQNYMNGLNFDYNEYENALQTAMGLAQKGLAVPDYLNAVIDRYNAQNGYGGSPASATLANLAAQATALKASNGKGKGTGATEEPIKDSDGKNLNLTNEHGFDSNGELQLIYVDGIGELTADKFYKLLEDGVIVQSTKETKNGTRLSYVKNTRWKP